MTSRPARSSPASAEEPGVSTVAVVCALCGADDARPYQQGMYAIGAQSFDLVRCRPCGFVYVTPQPDGQALAELYADPAYYTEGYNLGVETQNYFERAEELVAQYDGEIADLERLVGGPGDLLELGSAGGFLLDAARKRGWRVTGVELSPVAAAYSKKELGLTVFEGLLEDAPFEPGSFDLVIADNVLEHTTDPRAVLKDLVRLLRPGGHCLVVVPTYVNSPYFRCLKLLGRLLPRRLLGESLLRILKLDQGHDGGPPYHILEFDRRTLLSTMQDVGLRMVRVRRSVPFPSHLFKKTDPSLSDRLLRGVFRTLDFGMARGILPGARVWALGARPK